MAGAGALVPHDPRDRGVGGVHRPGRDARVLGVLGRVEVERHACSSSRLAPHRCLSRVEHRLSVVADRDPVEAAVHRARRSVVAWATPLAANTISLSPSCCAAGLSRVLLVPHDHGTESLAPVNAMSGSTPSRVRSTFSDGSAPADRSTPTCWKRSPRWPECHLLGVALRRDGVAVGRARADRLGHEDLVLVDARGVGALLLPGHPRTRLGRIGRRTTRDRGVLGALVGVDVQRWDRRAGRRRYAALTGEDPLAAGVVKPAGEDVVGAEAGAGRVLVPGGPRNGPSGPGEVDRRRLAVLALVEVQRAWERRAALDLPPTVPLPRVFQTPLANSG